MKTEETKKIEELLFKRLGSNEIGCGEVTIGWWGKEIVDFITCTVDKNRYINCFEIKVSKADFHSKASLTFIGNFNYFVMPEELCKEVEMEIPAGIGIYIKTQDDFGRDELRCVRRALYRDLKADKIVILSSMLRSMQREWFKALKSNESKEQAAWIPFMFDDKGSLCGLLPEDRQEILISGGKYVTQETFYIDDGCHLDSGDDFDDLAWMPLPEPYRKKEEK